MTNYIQELSVLLEGYFNYSLEVKTLLLIANNQPTEPKFLIKALSIAKSNLANLCKKLENNNFISKTLKKSDSRSIVYNITTEGEKYLAQKTKTFNFKFSQKFEDGLKRLLNNLKEK